MSRSIAADHNESMSLLCHLRGIHNADIASAKLPWRSSTRHSRETPSMQGARMIIKSIVTRRSMEPLQSYQILLLRQSSVVAVTEKCAYNRGVQSAESTHV